MADDLRILFVADVVGQPGRAAVKAILPGLKREVYADLTILNGENSAGGVLPVEDREVGVDLALQAGQDGFDGVATGLAHDVGNEQNPKVVCHRRTRLAGK